MEQINPQKMTPEQMDSLKEKLKNMSPEELREFQKKQCVFCQIIHGKVQAKKIFEDDKSLAILDINPANPGHILLFPKEHYTVMPQLSDDEIAHIFMVTKSLSNSILRSLEARGTNIIVANGPAAGQRAQHFMIHIIPRKENDKLEFTLPQKKLSEKDLDSIKEKLLGTLSKEKPKTEKKKFNIEGLWKPKPKVIEGEIVEEKKEGKKELKEKKPKSKKGKIRKKASKKKDVNLDDIAGLFG